MAQEDLVDYSDEEVPAKPRAFDGSEQWHSACRSSSAPQQALEALQQLHGRKPGRSSSPQQGMAPALAAAALQAFYDAQDASSQDISGTQLRSELVSSEVFAQLRTDARLLLATRRQSEGLSESQLQTEVREFLKRSWSSITLEGLGKTSETLVELRVAQLFGALLGRVPDAALRRQFETQLKEWSRRKAPVSTTARATGGRRPAKRQLAEELEALINLLHDDVNRSEEEKQSCAKKVMKLLIHAFSKNASKAQRRRAQELQPAMVAQVLTAVVDFNAELLEDHWEALPQLFGPLPLEELAELWAAVEGAPAVVRLAFLESLVVQEVQEHGTAKAVSTWQRAGVEPADVVAACVDYVFRDEEEEELYRHVPVPRRPRTRKRFLRMRKRVFQQEWWGPRGSVRIAGSSGSYSALPQRLPLTTEELLSAPDKALQAGSAIAEPEALNALGEQKEKESLEKRQRRQRKEQASAKRAGALLQWLEDSRSVDLSNLNPPEALRLLLVLGKDLGSAACRLLEAWLKDAQQEPLKYAEHVILSVSKALRSQPASAAAWTHLARLLLARWSMMAGSTLAPSLEVLPKKLTAAPNALRQALLTSCEIDPSAFRPLSWQQLCTVMEAWDRSPVPVPLSLRLLWVVAADPFIVCFRARQLVLASRLAAAEDLQDLELPEEVAVEDSASLVLEWWDRWLRSVLSNPAGWAFCREALRQALNWQRLLRRKRLPDEVPKAAAAKVLQVVVQRLGRLDKVEVPTQLLLELLEFEESGLEEKLAEELTRRIQASLCEGPLIPMTTAVALANGDTAIPCPRGSLLWSGLVASIAAQLKSKRQVDDFGACRPRPDLWDAVAQLKTGSWQSLELKLRRPFS